MTAERKPVVEQIAEIALRDALVADTPMRLLTQAESDRRILLTVCKALSIRLSNALGDGAKP